MNENVKKRLHLNNYRSFFCEKVRIRQLEKVKENVQRITNPEEFENVGNHNGDPTEGCPYDACHWLERNL